MDADIAASHAVVVEAGGFLSGTGTVNNVSVASGGGFAATTGQKGMPSGFALLRQGNTLVAGCVQGATIIFR
ncbi:MAG: hypothetical protein IJ658_00265 [Kiritimatiellae bacterium]|nr:hypothetical protein [Kiritimatiellia bacterium]